MFIGHFGAGFAAKRVAGKTSLGTFFLASQFIDLLWPTLLLVGVESVRIAPGDTRLTPLEFTHYPYSHSLLAVIAWAVLFGSAYYIIRRTAWPAIVCTALVISHWLLDALSHRPDLPLFPGSSIRIGLGLWNHPAPAVGFELLIFAGGLFLYMRTTRALDRIGSVGLWCLAAFLLLIYGVNLFGPPPPSVDAIAWASQAQWLLVAWGYRVDRHRKCTVS